jgi:FixJ family two-component response regulator
MRGDLPLIAIVDDELALQEALESLVRAAGFEVECYPSAEDFLGSGCVQRAACLVLDVSLPGMSGLDLQRHLAVAGSSIPIVFITSNDDGRCTRAHWRSCTSRSLPMI